MRPKFEHIWGSLCDEGALNHVGSVHMGPLWTDRQTDTTENITFPLHWWVVTIICLTSLTRAKCGIRSTLCWTIRNISGSIELFAL